MSLFELPSSRSGRRAKLALILVLDAILAGAGVVMLLAYLEARRASRPPAARSEDVRGGERGKVEVLPPTQVSPAPAAMPAPAAVPASAPEPAPPPSGAEPSRGEAAPDTRARPRPPSSKPRPKPKRSDRSDARRGEEPTGDNPPGVTPEWESEVADRLRDVVDGHRQDLERCYLAATNSDDPDEAPEGRIDIRFTLMSDGSAANVSPSANTTGSAELADCVVDLFRTWKFPGGHPEPLELEWPILFRAPVATAQQ